MNYPVLDHNTVCYTSIFAFLIFVLGLLSGAYFFLHEIDLSSTIIYGFIIFVTMLGFILLWTVVRKWEKDHYFN